MKQGNENIPAYVIHVCRKKLLNPKLLNAIIGII